MIFLRSNTAVIVAVGPLMNVGPAGAVHDSADVATVQVERISDRLMRLSSFGPLANRPDLIVRQRGVVMALALLASVVGHVLHVASAGVPPQIDQCVVAGIAINVTGLMVRGRALADKGFKYEVMNVTWLTATEHNDPTVVMRAGRSRASRLQLSPVCAESPLPLVSRPDRAVRTDTIANLASDVFVDNSHSSILSRGELL